MLKLITLSAILSLFNAIYSQEMTMVYEPDDSLVNIIIRDLIETSDDHLFVGFDVKDGGSTRSGIMKTNMDGEVIWEKNMIISGSDDCVFDVAENASGNYYLWGYGKNGGSSAIAYLLELNPDGEILWTKEYLIGIGGPYEFYQINQLEVLPSGDLHMMISTFEAIINMRTNAAGEIIWAKKIIVPDVIGIGKIPGFEWLTTHDGGGFCASKTDDYLLILRYDYDGELLWKRLFELGKYTHGKSIAKSTNGNLLITGYIQLDPESIFVPHIMELNPEDGSIIWIKLFDDLETVFQSRSHITVVDGRIYVDFTLQAESAEQYIVELNETGEVLNTMKCNTPVLDYNRLKIINEQAYFFGSTNVDENFHGVINRTTNITTESCLIAPSEELTTSLFNDYSEVFIDLEASDYTDEESISVYEYDLNLLAYDDCAASVQLEENRVVSSIHVYPNPTTQQLSLALTDNFVSANYIVFDMFGKTQLQGKVSQSNTNLDVSQLVNGQYILSIRSDKEVIAKQFTVSN